MRIATTLMVTALQLASVSMAAETLEGRVVSCDGYPLPYVSVALSTGETAITDAEGRFTFQVSPTSDLKISAGMNGLGEAVDHTCVAAGRSTRIDVILPLHVYDDCIPIGRNKLPESRRFDGTVTNIRFQPLRGATVRFLAIVPRLTPVSAATDRRGRFRTAQLPLGQYNVEVSAPGYLAKSFELWSAACEPACERPLIIRLSPGCE